MSDTKLVICEKCCGTGRVNGGDENSSWSKTCEDCHGIGFSIVPMSNADRIRSMSDEDMAKCIFEIGFGCHLCSEHERLSDNLFLRHEKCDEKCTEHCLEWLRQPAEGE